ncbi:hypothetical protein SESBI_08601 [Sesbania bispinosa]|nr:hypothetical protein SESBI_08601 [Sesbania bispinosa]
MPFAQEATACLLNDASVLDAKHPKFDERKPIKVKTEREEVQCSEWGDCYSSTRSSEREWGIADFGSSKKAELVAGGEGRES